MIAVVSAVQTHRCIFTPQLLLQERHKPCCSQNTCGNSLVMQHMQRSDSNVSHAMHHKGVGACIFGHEFLSSVHAVHQLNLNAWVCIAWLTWYFWKYVTIKWPSAGCLIKCQAVNVKHLNLITFQEFLKVLVKQTAPH